LHALENITPALATASLDYHYAADAVSFSIADLFEARAGEEQ
jgi:hypothetical protein